MFSDHQKYFSNLFFRIALKVVNEKLISIKTTDTKTSLLGEYLGSDDTDFKDVIGMTVDTLLAGIDTVILHFRYIFVNYNEYRNRLDILCYCIMIVYTNTFPFHFTSLQWKLQTNVFLHIYNFNFVVFKKLMVNY